MGQMTKEDIKRLFRFYEAVGIELVPKISTPKVRQKPVETLKTPEKIPSPGKINSLKLLREKIGDCKLCKLSGGRTKIVFGEGNPDTRILFIGEAPGREEDIQGRPFVGDAGRILTELIEWMHLKREQVYIANICKCRPAGNRDPEEDEVSACIQFLKEQIAIIKPLVILALGRVSAQNLLQTKVPIGKLRGNIFEFQGIPLVPTFHPAYILRSPGEKSKLGEDAKVALNIIRRKRS